MSDDKSFWGPFEKRDSELHYGVNSVFQRGITDLRILVPDHHNINHTSIVYVLPMEPGLGSRRGDGLQTIKQSDLHNQLGFICIMPSFSNWPWIGDHPTDQNLANERYMIQDIVPFVDRLYPQSHDGRYILGASKGGNAAISLLARHPGLFHGVSIWDAPLMKLLPDEWEMPLTYGSDENYRQYAIPNLLNEHAARFQDQVQIALHGFGMFREHTVAAHELMTTLGIAHEYDNIHHRTHVWNSGWVEDALRSLERMR